MPRTFHVATWLDDPSCLVGGAVAGVLARAVDALASSGMRVSAPPPPTTFDELWALHMTTIGWCGLFSVLGLPSMVLPAGLTADGLPVGVQVVAPHGHDHVAVAFARAATTAIGAVIGGGDRNAVRSPPPRS